MVPSHTNIVGNSLSQTLAGTFPEFGVWVRPHTPSRSFSDLLPVMYVRHPVYVTLLNCSNSPMTKSMSHFRTAALIARLLCRIGCTHRGGGGVSPVLAQEGLPRNIGDLWPQPRSAIHMCRTAARKGSLPLGSTPGPGDGVKKSASGE
jgi:hypothetical protein